MKFSEIEKLTQNAHYRINVSWDYLEEKIKGWKSEQSSCQLDLDPDFQRGHVWTEEQQIAFVEFKLRGGEGSNIIYFNCVGWMDSFEGPFVLVDGKQRLNAVLRFLNNEIKVFGYYYKEFEGRISSDCDFIFCVNNLTNYNDVLRWYLEMNSGGTPHTQAELDKVKDLLNKEN